MKNLVLFAGVMVAVCFASCGGNKAEAPAEEAEAVVEEVVEAAEACCADSCCADSCCADSCAAAVAE
ncbi:MAG: hypothetical protein KBT06_11750 [Prevotellaceae bacterium]|nr:hypothetical protein [Candidatus Colivivens equi]